MDWLNIGESLNVNARKYPDKIALKDARCTRTFPELDERTNKLANGLLGLGLEKGDKVAVLSNNCVEFMEIYLAAAKAGLVIVPINFRLTGSDMLYIIDNSEARAVVALETYCETIDSIRADLHRIDPDRTICIGEPTVEGYRPYEELLEAGSPELPRVKVAPADTWVLMYTSGTTGRPKGVVRSHRSYIAFFLINQVEFGYRDDDYGMIIMPLSHVNSTFYSFVFTYMGAGVYVHREFNFDPEELLGLIHEERITFTSMIPTHYALILDLPDEVKKRYDVSSIRSLLCSSAPVRKQAKLDIMEFFPKVRLFEAYGSTEAGTVTVLKPEEQLTHLGSIGRECVGTDRIKVLDEDGNEVPVGEVGELFSRGPMMFDKYYKLPEKTAQAFRGEWFSAGDMVRRDEDGYYTIVDRKDNMIITGGEHAYPSEVEEVISRHPSVFDVAVIGVPHHVWGEAVMAVVILKEGAICTADEMKAFCAGRMAGFKKPKIVEFIPADEMPRTATGKILHRKLRERFRKNYKLD